jgi:hypothetical protein
MGKLLKILFLSFLFLSIGCDNKPMTNQEVIAACKECEKAGMKPQIIQQLTWDGITITVRVNCIKNEIK